MAKNNDKSKDKDKKEEITTADILGASLESNKDTIFNEIIPENFRISFGSLVLDRELGGLGAGLQRFIGINEGGKTSEALLVAKNFLETIPNSRAVYFKAEGKLPPEVIKRSGIVFTKKLEEWKDGTCFIVETNVAETVEDIMKKLVRNNPEGKKFFFILDSVDGLITLEELEKDTRKSNKSEENQNAKPAGIAKFCNDLLKAINNRLSLEGHIAVFISQVRSTITIGYAKKEQQQGQSKNGNAVQHYANWVIQFESRVQDDLIKQNEKAKPSPENPILGHWAKVTVIKSPCEKTGLLLKYPIKYGREGGNSIWKELEIGAILISDGYYKGTNWLTIEPNFAQELKDAGLTFEEKVQGEKNLYSMLEENPALTKYLYAKFRDEASKE